MLKYTICVPIEDARILAGLALSAAFVWGVAVPVTLAWAVAHVVPHVA